MEMTTKSDETINAGDVRGCSVLGFSLRSFQVKIGNNSMYTIQALLYMHKLEQSLIPTIMLHIHKIIIYARFAQLHYQEIVLSRTIFTLSI